MVNNTILVTKFILNFLINLILNFFINFVLTFTHNRNEVLADLRKRISVNENDLLDKFFELDNDVAYEEIKNGFIYGFSLGSKLMSQIV